MAGQLFLDKLLALRPPVAIGEQARTAGLDPRVQSVEYWLDTAHDWATSVRVSEVSASLHRNSQKTAIGTETVLSESAAARVLQTALAPLIDPRALALDFTRAAPTTPHLEGSLEALHDRLLPGGAPTPIPIQFTCHPSLLSSKPFYDALIAIVAHDTGGLETQPLQVSDVQRVRMAGPSRLSVGGFHGVDSGVQPRAGEMETAVELGDAGEITITTSLPTGDATWAMAAPGPDGARAASFTFRSGDQVLTVSFPAGLDTRGMTGLPTLSALMDAYLIAQDALLRLPGSAIPTPEGLLEMMGKRALTTNDLPIASVLVQALRDGKPALLIQRFLEAIKFCGDNTLTELARANKATVFTTGDQLTWCMAIKKGIPCCVFIGVDRASVWYSNPGANPEALRAALAAVNAERQAAAEAAARAAEEEAAARRREKALLAESMKSLCRTITRLLMDGHRIFVRERERYPVVLADSADPDVAALRDWIGRLDEQRAILQRLTPEQTEEFIREAAQLLPSRNVAAANYRPDVPAGGAVYLTQLDSVFEFLRAGPANPQSRQALYVSKGYIGPAAEQRAGVVEPVDRLVMIYEALTRRDDDASRALLAKVAGWTGGEADVVGALVEMGAAPAPKRRRNESSSGMENRSAKRQQRGGGDARHAFCERYTQFLVRLLRVYIAQQSRTPAAVAGIVNLLGANVSLDHLNDWLLAHPDDLMLTADTNLPLLRFPAASIAGSFYLLLFLRGFDGDDVPNWSLIRQMTRYFLSEQGYQESEMVMRVVSTLDETTMAAIEQALTTPDQALSSHIHEMPMVAPVRGGRRRTRRRGHHTRQRRHQRLDRRRKTRTRRQE